MLVSPSDGGIIQFSIFVHLAKFCAFIKVPPAVIVSGRQPFSITGSVVLRWLWGRMYRWRNIAPNSTHYVLPIDNLNGLCCGALYEDGRRDLEGD